VAPQASAVLRWLDGLIEPTQRLGSELFSWFGRELPRVLPMASLLFNELMEAIRNLGRQLSPIFEKMAQDPKAFQIAIEQTVRNVVDAVVGFVRNLDRLAQWWDRDGRKMAGDAGTVLSAIGTAVQIAAMTIDIFAETARRVGRVFDDLGRTIDGIIGKIQGLIWWIGQIPGHKQITIGFGGGGGLGGDFSFQHGGLVAGGVVIGDEREQDAERDTTPWWRILAPAPAPAI